MTNKKKEQNGSDFVTKKILLNIHDEKETTMLQLIHLMHDEAYRYGHINDYVCSLKLVLFRNAHIYIKNKKKKYFKNWSRCLRYRRLPIYMYHLCEQYALYRKTTDLGRISTVAG